MLARSLRYRVSFWSLTPALQPYRPDEHSPQLIKEVTHMRKILLSLAVYTFGILAHSSIEAIGGSCMYNPGKGEFETCRHVVDGKCAHYAGSCEPSDSCIFNPETAKFHKCTRFSLGECKEYEPVTCKPNDSCAFNVRTRKYQNCAHFSDGSCHSFTTDCAPD